MAFYLRSMSDSPQALRLSELTTALEAFFQKKFSNRPVWVIAEISSHKYYAKSNRHYFDLIEKQKGGDHIAAKMQAISWGNVGQRIQDFERTTGQAFTNGLEVMLQVEVSFHAQYGLKLTVMDINEHFTLGQMEKHRRETLEKLRTLHPQVVRKIGENYRTFNQDRPIPKVIQRIALVTSSQAAGNDDFLHSLKDNRFGYTFKIDYYYTPVQGIQSWPKITSRIAEINEKFDDYDLLVIVRGGGAQTDLMLFDQYELNLEIARCAVPVFTGIGHHKDQSIADLFCHTRLKTPTAVAAAIIEHNMEFEQTVLGRWEEVDQGTKHLLDKNQRLLGRASLMITGRVPQKIAAQQHLQVKLHRALTKALSGRFEHLKEELREAKTNISHKTELKTNAARNRLKQQEDQLPRAIQSLLKNQETELKHLQKLVDLVHPKRTLQRGYALLRNGDGIITSVDQLKKGEEIEMELKDGKRGAVVKGG